MTIKVLIIDDSALIRSILSEIINGEHDMEVVGTAPDPLVAREKIKALNPDVLTLDVEMPKMDGIEYAKELTDKIRVAAKARLSNYRAPAAALTVDRKNTADVVLAAEHHSFSSTEKVIIVGASTGGTEALKEFLVTMPADSPGILITQHMPETFTKTFAKRLDGLCTIAVKEAEHGDRVLPGHAYVAPGNRHLLLQRSGANYVVQISDGPPVSRHRPSVDVLFRSAANCAGKNAVGIIMTGMGDDGAAGMLEMHQAGAYTLAQDEQSCVVFGMPKEAIALGGVDEVVPLTDLSRRLLVWLAAQGKRSFRV